MLDRRGNEFHPKPKGPQTGAELKAMVEGGELGPVGASTDAAEMEMKQNSFKLAMQVAANALEKWAGELETGELAEKDIKRRHSMMATADAFRISAHYMLKQFEPKTDNPNGN